MFKLSPHSTVYPSYLEHGPAHSKCYLEHGPGHSKCYLEHGPAHSKCYLEHGPAHRKCLDIGMQSPANSAVFAKVSQWVLLLFLLHLLLPLLFLFLLFLLSSLPSNLTDALYASFDGTDELSSKLIFPNL